MRNNSVLMKFILWLAALVGKMRRILCSDWLPKPIRIVSFDPLASKKSHGATYKVRNFLTMSSMESPKTTKDIQNKENKRARGRAKIVGFPSQSLEINKSFLILIAAKSFSL